MIRFLLENDGVFVAQLRRFLKLPKETFLIVVLVITFLAFLPALKAEFVNWDDQAHLYENPVVKLVEWPGMLQHFRRMVLTAYMPLTTLSYAVEYHFFGLNPFVYHFTNVALHVIVTALIFQLGILFGLPQRAVFWGALIFGIHPVHVESVAWVTERKDVLYSIFYLLALIRYWRYLESGKPLEFIWSLIWGTVSMLAKPMALSLPLVLLLLDGMKSRKWRIRIFAEKIPYAVILAPIAWITMSANVQPPEILSLGESLLIFLYTFMFYIQKFFYPVNLVPYYPPPYPIVLSNPVYNIAVLSLFVLIATLIVFRKSRWLYFAVAFYFASIFFLLRFDHQHIIVVADRYMYLPSMGFCFLIGVILERFISQTKFFLVPVVLLCAGLFWGTWTQVKVWKNSFSLWTHEIKHFPHVALAYKNRGQAYLEKGDLERAMEDTQKALSLDPDYGDALNNRGSIHLRQGNREAAWADFTRAVEADPLQADAWYNRGTLLIDENRNSEALPDLTEAIRIKPVFVQAYMNRGVAYGSLGDFKKAEENFSAVLRLDPENRLGYQNRIHTYIKMGQDEKALADIRMLQRLGVDFSKNTTLQKQ